MARITAAEIEESIDAAVDTLGRNLAARGLWDFMQRRIRKSSHSGHLRIGRSAGTLEALSNRLKLPFARTSGLVTRLKKVDVLIGKKKTPSPLVEVTANGVVYCPLLKRLKDLRKDDAVRSDRRRRKGVTSHPNGCDDGCDEGVTVPPDGFSPNPSSLSPPTSSSAGAKPGVREPPPDDGTDLDARIRRFIGGHRMLLWDLKTHAKFRSLVEADGWDRACELVDEGVAAGAPFPVGWALGKAQRLSTAKRAARPVEHKPAGAKTENWD
jgi:hypothetical protein